MTDHRLPADAAVHILKHLVAEAARQPGIRTGQVYRDCDPRSSVTIRIITYRPGDPRPHPPRLRHHQDRPSAPHRLRARPRRRVTVSPWLVLAGALLGAGLGAALLALHPWRRA